MGETLSWSAEVDGARAQGVVEAGPHAGVVRVAAELPAGTLGTVVARMPWPLEPDEVVWMNGYQTWTFSPELRRYGKLRGTDRLPSALLRRYSFDRYGDYHFVRYGHHAGQSHGFTYGYFRRGDRFRLVASLSEQAGYTIIRYDARAHGGAGELVFERDCAGVEHAGGEFSAFELFFAEGTEDEVFDAWFAAMGVAPCEAPKLCGYSSWYNRYQDISEAAIRADLDGCRSLLAPGDLFQVDDGWEPKVGDWLCADTQKFPGGMASLASSIHDAGFQAGLWLAPFVCEQDSALMREHPDWLLLHNGKPWKLGCNWSGFYALDIDNPEVVAYVRQVFEQVVGEWGFDLVKLDFLYGAAPFGAARESRAARMRRAMELLRECCGDVRILGCGVPVAPAFGLVDYCRVGCDVTLDPDDVWYMRWFHRERSSARQCAANTLTRRELNGRAWGSDPDVFFVRDWNIRLSEAQRDELATLNALLGSVFLTSDDPSRYTDAQRRRYAELRDLFEHAEDVRVDLDARTVSYRLRGEEYVLVLALPRLR